MTHADESPPRAWRAHARSVHALRGRHRGNLAAAIGIALCGALHLPADALIYRRLRVVHRRLAWFGSLVLHGSLAAAIAIDCLAPFPGTWTSLRNRSNAAASLAV